MFFFSRRTFILRDKRPDPGFIYTDIISLTNVIYQQILDTKNELKLLKKKKSLTFKRFLVKESKVLSFLP